jgi:hypothetical protein
MMNPRDVPFGTINCQRPGRGKRALARHVFAPLRRSMIWKPSCGMSACTSEESPETVP